MAGKIVYEDAQTKVLTTKLLRIRDPIITIPNLAIHLTTEKNKFEWNNETHLKGVIATTFFDNVTESEEQELTKVEKKIGRKLSNLIAEELEINKADIVDFDLILYDTQPSTLFGINKEFVASGRLDNLGSSLTSVHALIKSAEDVDVQSSINMIALFDNEEVGSQSYTGADCQFFAKSLQRIFKAIEKTSDEQKDVDEAYSAACARSFIISCDMAHAFHPNYPEKYQNEHKPLIHGGVTLKINCTNKYTTDSEGAALVKSIGKKANVPIQEFIVRQDSPCGTTIGPIITSHVGIKTVDVGIPQLAMHSIREMCGVMDLLYYRNFYEEFFASYEQLIGKLNIN